MSLLSVSEQQTLTPLLHALQTPEPTHESPRILCYDQLDSTNTEAKRLLAASAHPEHLSGTLLIADTQTRGRGRGDHTWESPRGTLPFTLILTSVYPAHHRAALPLVIGLALYNALSPLKLANPNARFLLKWPNDLLVVTSSNQASQSGNSPTLTRKKVAGILVESYPLPTHSKQMQTAFIIGIGINLKSDLKDLPPHPSTPPTSLFQEGIHISSKDFLNLFLIALKDIWATFEEKGFSPCREAYLQASQLVGAHVIVTDPQMTHSGQALDVNDDGALILRTETGEITCYTGDLV